MRVDIKRKCSNFQKGTAIVFDIILCLENPESTAATTDIKQQPSIIFPVMFAIIGLCLFTLVALLILYAVYLLVAVQGLKTTAAGYWSAF